MSNPQGSHATALLMAPLTFVVAIAVAIPMLFGGSNCGAAISSTGPTSNAVSVLTWNVCASSCSDWPARARHMTSQVAAASADVVAVQEGGWSKKNRRPTIGGVTSLGYKNAQSDGPFIGRYIFYKPSKFKLLQAGGFSLGGSHGVAWAKLRTTADRTDFVVVNVHLLNGQSAASDATRRTQINKAIAKVEPVADDLPVIWAGDFNSNGSRASDTPTAALKTIGVTDTIKRTKARTNADVNSARSRSKSAKVERHGHQVDHVYATADVTVWSWTQILYAFNGVYLPPFVTDHNALLVVVGLTAEPPAEGIEPASFTTSAATSAGSWSAEQLANAKVIVGTGGELNVSGQGQTIAVMTALGESSLRVLNYGDRAGPDSRGLFQQRASWGPLSVRMDPAGSSRLFYNALLAVDGWESMTPTQAAHKVQRNADPNHYTRFYASAQEIVALVGGEASAAGCDDTTLANVIIDGVSFPLPAVSQYVSQNNFGQSGGRWSRNHTGNDYSVACGTPVLASTAGTVVIDKRESSWAGPFPVKISTGKGRLTTWYMHMQRINVTAGQQVKPGQKIGDVGNLGNSSGCHLHFEVHPQGGSIYQDAIDPVKWFKTQLNSGRDNT